MIMNEDVREDEIEEDGSSIVEIEEETSSDEIEVSSTEKKETRTNVRENSKSSEGDEELSSFSDGVQRRINQLTAKRKQASEEAQAAYQYAQQKKQKIKS